MKKKKNKDHINSCAGQAGFNYSFDNGKIINYQDNFKKLGDLPFAVYYDRQCGFFRCKNVCG